MPRKKRKISERQSCYLAEEEIKIVREGDIDSLKIIIENQPEIVNKKDEDECSLLYYAVLSNNKEIAELLLEKGADIESKSYFGSTPLHIAASNLNLELIELLVEKGANIKAVNNNCCNALHSAASGIIDEWGKWEKEENWWVIEYLLEVGVPMNKAAEEKIERIFYSQDWSLAEEYKERKEEVKNGKAKIKRDEIKKLRREIEEMLDYLMPEESSSNYKPIKSLLETIVANQKELFRKEGDMTTEINLIATKEFAVIKGLERERVEELCQKVANLLEITVKKNQIEFIEVEGKPQTIKFN